MAGLIETWKRTGRSRRGRDELGESRNGNLRRDPSKMTVRIEGKSTKKPFHLAPPICPPIDRALHCLLK